MLNFIRLRIFDNDSTHLKFQNTKYKSLFQLSSLLLVILEIKVL